jgi:hypothetical protein
MDPADAALLTETMTRLGAEGVYERLHLAAYADAAWALKGTEPAM